MPRLSHQQSKPPKKGVTIERRKINIKILCRQSPQKIGEGWCNMPPGDGRAAKNYNVFSES